MLAGAVAGLLVFVLARWIGEPQVEHAIAFETSMDPAKGEAPEPEIVSRKSKAASDYCRRLSSRAQLLVESSRSSLPSPMDGQPASPRALSALLAGLGFVTLAVIPALKYPANPPSAGNPETIGVRTAEFFLLLALSIVAMVLAVKVESLFHKRLGGWNASLIAVALFVVVITVVLPFLAGLQRGSGGIPGDAHVEVSCCRS
jgi:hypothetical protein